MVCLSTVDVKIRTALPLQQCNAERSAVQRPRAERADRRRAARDRRASFVNHPAQRLHAMSWQGSNAMEGVALHSAPGPNRAVPFLPGMSYGNPARRKFSKGHIFEFKVGVGRNLAAMGVEVRDCTSVRLCWWGWVLTTEVRGFRCCCFLVAISEASTMIAFCLLSK
jgi:hypothetical protein